MKDDISKNEPTSEEDALHRRGFLKSFGKWSGAAIAAVVTGCVVPYGAGAASWINRRGRWINGGGGWINRSVGGGRWVNRGGGGGWVNRRGGGAGAWANRRGGGGGRWVNRR